MNPGWEGSEYVLTGIRFSGLQWSTSTRGNPAGVHGFHLLAGGVISRWDGPKNQSAIQGGCKDWVDSLRPGDRARGRVLLRPHRLARLRKARNHCPVLDRTRFVANVRLCQRAL